MTLNNLYRDFHTSTRCLSPILHSAPYISSHFFCFLASHSLNDFVPLLYFSTNPFFIPPHPWQHLYFVSIILHSVPLRGVVDCTVAHSAVIQCYWGCCKSVLCDQEPCCTLWQMTKVRLSIDESVTATKLWWDQLIKPLLLLTFAGWGLCISLCSLLCDWVSPSARVDAAE